MLAPIAFDKSGLDTNYAVAGSKFRFVVDRRFGWSSDPGSPGNFGLGYDHRHKPATIRSNPCKSCIYRRWEVDRCWGIEKKPGVRKTRLIGRECRSIVSRESLAAQG